MFGRNRDQSAIFRGGIEVVCPDDQSAICPGRIEIHTRGVSHKTRIKGRLTGMFSMLTRLMYISIMPLGQQMTSTRRSATLSTPPHAFSTSV